MHTHAHGNNKTHSKHFPLCAFGLWESLRIVYDIWHKRLKERAAHAFLICTNTHKPNNRDKRRKTAEKALSPFLCEEGQGTRLLPNVGVPKILPDRKFPILRRILKSCGHPNAVTVILLTLIAFLHIPAACPSFRPSVFFCHRTLSFIYSTEPGYAGLLLITRRRACGTQSSTGS